MTASEEALPPVQWKRWGTEGPALWPQKAVGQRASGGAGLGGGGGRSPARGQGRAPVLAASEEASPCCVCVLGRLVVSDSMTPCAVACQAPLSMGFSRQESWSGLPFPSPRDLPNSGIKPASPVFPTWQVDSLPAEPLGEAPSACCSSY